MPMSIVWFLQTAISNIFNRGESRNMTGRTGPLSSGSVIAFSKALQLYFCPTLLTFSCYRVKLYLCSSNTTSPCKPVKLYITFHTVIKPLISLIEWNRTKARKCPWSILIYCHDNVSCKMSNTNQFTPASVETVFFWNGRQKLLSLVHKIVWIIFRLNNLSEQGNVNLHYRIKFQESLWQHERKVS